MRLRQKGKGSGIEATVVEPRDLLRGAAKQETVWKVLLLLLLVLIALAVMRDPLPATQRSMTTATAASNMPPLETNAVSGEQKREPSPPHVADHDGDAPRKQHSKIRSLPPLRPQKYSPRRPMMKGSTKSSLVRCQNRTEEELKPYLMAQSEEDKRLLEYWFNGMCNGVYLEMGGLDGVRYSNTFVFHHAFDWKGILVEGSPRNYESLQINRPNEMAVVGAAVCDAPRTIHYYETGAVGGIWEFADEAFRSRFWPGVTIDQAEAVECLPLNDILAEHGGGTTTHFDFFSLDIEGAELMALQSLDFDRYSFGVILVEADGRKDPNSPKWQKNERVNETLVQNGYTFMGRFHRSFWFVHNDFANIYHHVMAT